MKTDTKTEQAREQIEQYSEKDKRTFENGFYCAVSWMKESNQQLKHDYETLKQHSEEQQEKYDKLEKWKESAMSVMPDYQKIGKLLNIPLGQSVHDKIVGGIEELQKQIRAGLTINDKEG